MKVGTKGLASPPWQVWALILPSYQGAKSQDTYQSVLGLDWLGWEEDYFGLSSQPLCFPGHTEANTKP